MHIQCVRSGCMQHVQFHIGRRFHLPLLLLVETRVRRNDKTAGTGGWEVKLFTSSVINLYLYEGAGFAILNNFKEGDSSKDWIFLEKPFAIYVL